MVEDSWTAKGSRSVGLHSGRPSHRLVLFARYPEPGTTKTRLIPVLGRKGAADLQRRMTEQTLRTARKYRDKERVSLEVRHHGGNEVIMKRWLGDDVVYTPQGRGDLGRRMLRAFEEAFSAGFLRVVVIGTDCPEIREEHLGKAFSCLRERPLVLGPAKDGGYYLIGLKVNADALFEGVSWGTERVLSETLERAERLGLTVDLLEQLQDVDRPEDLAVCERMA